MERILFSLLDTCTLCLLCGTTNDYAVAQWNSCALFCWIMFLFFVLFSQPCWHCHAWQLITDSNWNKDDRRRWTKNSIYWFKVNFTSCLFRFKLDFYAFRVHLEQILVTSFLPSPVDPISYILIFGSQIKSPLGQKVFAAFTAYLKRRFRDSPKKYLRYAQKGIWNFQKAQISIQRSTK